MSEGVVTPSLLPPPIISAGWIKLALDRTPKGPLSLLTAHPDLIYPPEIHLVVVF